MNNTNLTILVVYDNDEDRVYLLRELEQSGLSCDVVEASDMEEAQAACQTQTFDCAFVDYHMPGEDGFSVISNFQRQFPNMATIMVTGQGDEVVASQVMKLGAGDYIAKKHVNALNLKHSIESVLEKAVSQRKLVQQREELQNFSRVLAHDLKSPTRNIRNMIGLLKERMAELALADDEDVIQYMFYVCMAADRMDALVDALTSYTKFDAKVEFQEISLEEVVAVAAAFLESDIQNKSAKVVFQDLPMIYGHEPQLNQLFQNLIANALKYNESDSPIIIISAEQKDRMIHVVVQDNGIGIPEKHHRTIFEPFKRLHGNDSQYAGTGLGLSTCKNIVERHGGAICCESTTGKGTTFNITFSSDILAPVLI